MLMPRQVQATQAVLAPQGFSITVPSIYISEPSAFQISTFSITPDVLFPHKRCRRGSKRFANAGSGSWISTAAQSEQTHLDSDSLRRALKYESTPWMPDIIVSSRLK